MYIYTYTHCLYAGLEAASLRARGDYERPCIISEFRRVVFEDVVFNNNKNNDNNNNNIFDIDVTITTIDNRITKLLLSNTTSLNSRIMLLYVTPRYVAWMSGSRSRSRSRSGSGSRSRSSRRRKTMERGDEQRKRSERTGPANSQARGGLDDDANALAAAHDGSVGDSA